jgi:NHLM bacteriocin system ABC transporter peptidase/ATP-binding protein
MEPVECGAAALAMVFAHYGVWVTLPELRQTCAVSRDGSNALNLVKAARRFGFEARGQKKSLEAVQQLEAPFIVFWKLNHFLVVEGFDRAKNRVYLNDPAEGRRWVSFEAFDDCFSGVVLLVRPGSNVKLTGRRRSSLEALRRRLAGSQSGLWYCFGTGLVLLIPAISLPLLVQVFVDYVLVRGMTGWLEPLLWAMGGLAVARALLKLLERVALCRLDAKLSTSLTSRFLWHVLALPASYFSQRYLGDIAGRIEENDAVAGTVARRLAASVPAALSAVGALAILLSYDLVLTGICAALAATSLLAMRAALPPAQLTAQLGIEQASAAGVAVGGLQTLETIKAAGIENDFFSRWAGYFTRAANTRQRLALRAELAGLVPPAVEIMCTAAILLLGGLKVLDGHMTIGMLVAYQALTGTFLGAIQRLAALGPTVAHLTGRLDRLDDVLAHPQDPEARRQAAPPGDAPAVRLTGHIELRDVSFGFSPVEPPLIENLSLTLKPGQRVALVGASGSGKSTVAKLVSGLYQPWSGQIRFDGRERQLIARRILATSLAMVEQDFFLFEGTIRDNLTLWDDTVAHGDLIEACRDADIHDFIAALPGAYDHDLQEGAANFSGGQRQRLEIARSLLADPSILILDEATSALDAASERVIDANIRRRGCTCLIVAHRLSTVRDCDEIIVFDRGTVVQRGTHDALIGQPGHYRDLVLTEAVPA